MSKVYLQRPGALPDELLGRVESNGRVHRSYPGPDDEIGRVNLDTGRVHAQRLGVDEYIGRVELDNGKVYRHVAAGPDEYLGRVHEDGRIHYDVAARVDDYVGRISGNASLAQAGAAFLLLVWPAFAENQ